MSLLVAMILSNGSVKIITINDKDKYTTNDIINPVLILLTNSLLFINDLPIGMQIMGNMYDEAKIYQLASFIEKELNLDLEGGSNE